MSMTWKIESSLKSPERDRIQCWHLILGAAYCQRKASFSEHERLGVFEILGLLGHTNIESSACDGVENKRWGAGEREELTSWGGGM